MCTHYHKRPIGQYNFTALRISPHKNAPFILPQINIFENENVTVVEKRDGYGKIIKNGREGWCNEDYLKMIICSTPISQMMPKISSKHNPVVLLLNQSGMTGALIKPAKHFTQNKSNTLTITKNPSSTKLSEYSCKHKTCIENGNIRGVGAVIVVKHYVKHCCKNYVIFGKERGGTYAGKYNVIGGSLNSGECPVKAIHREVFEEIKLFHDGDWTTWNNIFKYNGSTTVTFRINKTLEFMGLLHGDANKIVETINRRILQANNNSSLPSCLKEMDGVVLVSTTGDVIGDNKKNVELSSYAKRILKDHADKINKI